MKDEAERARWQQLDALLDQALQHEEPERDAFVRAIETNDPATGAALRGLLRAATAVDGVLDGAAWGRIGFGDERAHHSGEMIARYRLVEKIGTGGMGEVWLATALEGSEPSGPPVALKLILSTLSRAVLSERLQRERDILMRLNHPGIARLLDSGLSAAGDPYLVLEYVQGRALLDYAAAQQLGLRQRLMLFAQICAAVAAAQARLVVHRDIKPQNILVTADGQPKLLDFGIAKLVDQSGFGESTELTAQLGRALTPAYAAPEQLAGEPVSTATDVYSLGVVLHELLLGSRPSPRSGEQELVAPSKLAKRGHSAVGLGLRAAALAKHLRGDLDCLLRQALALSPADRYSNAQALMQDIEAYLAARPLQARADSAGYRLAKLIARHPLASLSTMVALGAVLVAGVVAWQQSVFAHRAAARAAYVQTFLEALFANDLPGAPRDGLPTTAELLERGASQALQARDAEPGARLALLLSLARIQQGQRELAAAERSLVAALSLLPEVADAPAWQAVTIAGDLAAIRAQQAPSERAAGIEALRSAIARAQQLHAPATWQLTALTALVSAEVDLDQGDAARAHAQQAIALLGQIQQPSATLQLTVLTQAVVAHTYDQQFRPEALIHARAALTLAQQAFGAQHAETAYARMRVAQVLRLQGELPAALSTVQAAVNDARVAYPPLHLQLARILEESARIHLRNNQSEAGVALWREVLKIRQSAITESASDAERYAVYRTEAFLASALLRIAAYDEAATVGLRAERGLRDSVGRDHPLWFDACSYAASALIALQRPADALAILPSADGAVPSSLAPTTRWRFMELQLLAAGLQPQAQRAAALNGQIQRLAAEPGTPREFAILLMSASAQAIENQWMDSAQTALAAAASRLKARDPTQLMAIHALLALLAQPEPADTAALRAARDVVAGQRGEHHYAVRLADQLLKK